MANGIHRGACLFLDRAPATYKLLQTPIQISTSSLVAPPLLARGPRPTTTTCASAAIYIDSSYIARALPCCFRAPAPAPGLLRVHVVAHRARSESVSHAPSLCPGAHHLLRRRLLSCYTLLLAKASSSPSSPSRSYVS
jgi:hypothetical protein